MADGQPTDTQSTDRRVEYEGAVLTWDPRRRVARLTTTPGVRLTSEHALVIGRAVAGWTGTPPTAAYAFVVRGEPLDDAGTDRGYRETLGRGARAHADHIHLVFHGGTAEARSIAAMYLRAVGAPGVVVETEAEAAAWLEQAGFGARNDDGPAHP